MNPKILFIDIESTPIVAHTWGLRDQTIAPSQIVQPPRVLCFAAKWRDDPGVKFFGSKKTLVLRAHELMSRADAIVHYNGNSFDIPFLNAEFVMAGLTPPAPAKQIDLYRVVKKNFRFPSGRLDYIAKALGLNGKVKHSGHELWTRCMAGDKAAWKEMRAYNVRDVELLEELYGILLPWIGSHPNFNLYLPQGEAEGCPNCGSGFLKPRGYAYTCTGKYQRYVCESCGKWTRAGRRVATVDVRGVAT